MHLLWYDIILSQFLSELTGSQDQGICQEDASESRFCPSFALITNRQGGKKNDSICSYHQANWFGTEKKVSGVLASFLRKDTECARALSRCGDASRAAEISCSQSYSQEGVLQLPSMEAGAVLDCGAESMPCVGSGRLRLSNAYTRQRSRAIGDRDNDDSSRHVSNSVLSFVPVRRRGRRAG